MSPGLTVGVIVCAFTEDRWGDLAAGVRELRAQIARDDQVIVVIDHNEPMLARARRELVSEQVRVLANGGSRGLSGGRNTGTRACRGDLALFLDDDASPKADWIASYRAVFAESPEVVAVGGAVEPEWDGGSAPRWFPSEFGWVVGCDYTGLPPSGSEIRNPIGASMAIRASALAVVGGFTETMGRVGSLPVGCEETELAIRMRRDIPGARIVRDTTPVVRHRVPKARQTVRYFTSRCFHEGRSKAAITTLAGTQRGLSSERAYVASTLVRGFGRHSLDTFRGDPYGLLKAAMLPIGLVFTTAGYVRAKLAR